MQDTRDIEDELDVALTAGTGVRKIGERIFAKLGSTGGMANVLLRDAGPVREAEELVRSLIARQCDEPDHITPERAAAMLAIDVTRVRRLCQTGGAGYRISPGRWGVDADWLAAEIVRRERLVGTA